jgi:hypothetical protein
MTGPPLVVYTGEAISRVVQCYVDEDGTVPAVFNASDIIVFAIIKHGQTWPTFLPTVAFATTNVKTGQSQTGFEQGQILFSYTSTQAALLIPACSYSLVGTRALASNPSNTEGAAEIPLVVKAIA